MKLLLKKLSQWSYLEYLKLRLYLYTLWHTTITDRGLSVCLISKTMTCMGRKICAEVLRGKVCWFQHFSLLEQEVNYSLSSLGVTELGFLKLREKTKYRVAVACLLNRLGDAIFRCRSKLLKSLLLLCFQVLYNYWLMLKNKY